MQQHENTIVVQFQFGCFQKREMEDLVARLDSCVRFNKLSNDRVMSGESLCGAKCLPRNEDSDGKGQGPDSCSSLKLS